MDTSCGRESPPRPPGLRPDEPAPLQPLGIQRHAEPVVPKDLHQIAAAAPEHVEVTRRADHAPAPAAPAAPGRSCRDACRCPRRQPHPHAGGDRDHRAAPPARAAARPGSRRCPPGPGGRRPARSRSGPLGRRAGAVPAASGESADGPAARSGGSSICTGTNTGISAAVSTPVTHLPPPGEHQALAHAVPRRDRRTRAPGSCVSATMRSLSSVLQRRRRSRPVMISTTPSIATPQAPP